MFFYGKLNFVGTTDFDDVVPLPWGLEAIDVDEAPYESYGEITTHPNYFINAYWISEKLRLDSWVIEARRDTSWGNYLGGSEDVFTQFSYSQSNAWYYEFSGTESINELKLLCEVSLEHEIAERLNLLAQYAGDDAYDTDQWIGNDQLHTKLLERGFLPEFGEDELRCRSGSSTAVLYDSEKLRAILECGAPLAKNRTSLEDIRFFVEDDFL